MENLQKHVHVLQHHDCGPHRKRQFRGANGNYEERSYPVDEVEAKRSGVFDTRNTEQSTGGSQEANRRTG